MYRGFNGRRRGDPPGESTGGAVRFKRLEGRIFDEAKAREVADFLAVQIVERADTAIAAQANVPRDRLALYVERS